MQETKVEIPRGYMLDAQGRLVPRNKVKEIDRERDRLVKDLFNKALNLHQLMAVYKDDSMSQVKEFVQHSADQYGVQIGGKKGNVTLVSFDGEYKVTLAINDYITFDERLKVAKELVDNCIRRWAKGARGEIKVLVEDAFQVDKQGKVNTKRILGLRRLDIQDEEWKKAMDAISESVTVLNSKEYIRIYHRQEDGSYDQLPLDLAAV